ncbi:hypothetical protein GVN16_03350 [Emticicia sp. CRIBPO]|uniref:hypothetical protein n=1 Tax=Emticicia sp. CRIBPO TaxID=2683258 RepID=UPI001411D763|nr:hypothetical protein [Emticicia sp. CRIBPO]NBA84776.1 hypothetical protein [Emticicia sp. CRIBPO]
MSDVVNCNFNNKKEIRTMISDGVLNCSTENSLDKLIEMGFSLSANIALNKEGDKILIEYEGNKECSNILYAFIVEDSDSSAVRYIGHSRRSFENRMYGYQIGKGFAVNMRVNREMKTQINQGKNVKIYSFHKIVDDYCNLKIDFASGLEYSLINYYSNYNHDNGLKTLINIEGNVYCDKEKKSVMRTNSEQIAEEINYLDKKVIEEITSEGEPFRYKLWDTYYNKSFINIPVEFDDLFGVHGAEVKIDFRDDGIIIEKLIAKIDRKANDRKGDFSGTPRIYIPMKSGGRWFIEWKQKNFKPLDLIKAELLGFNHIIFKKG